MLPAGIRIVFAQCFQNIQALVCDQKPDMLQAAILQIPQKAAPALQNFAAALSYIKNFAIAFLVHTGRHKDGNRFDFAAPCLFESDAFLENNGIFLHECAVVLGFDPLKKSSGSAH